LGPGEYSHVIFKHDCNVSTRIQSDQDGESLKIENLIFDRANIQTGCYLNFENVRFQNIQFDASQNNGSIGFLNCIVISHFEVLRSSLGKCSFTNMDIYPGSHFDLLDSNINDVSFNSFRWRNFKLNEEYNDSKYSTRLNFLISVRESYRQLKANYLKSGNKIEALEFQRAELETHLKVLSFERFDSLKSFGNYLIVGSNKLFSDFGQNIWKPLLFLASFHLLWFAILLLLKFNVYPTFSNIDWSITWQAFDAYFSTLLPTHSGELVIAENKKIIWGWVDLFMRISSGYFIFYFVYSSRKYHQ
jgi:hypothetical protein